MHSLFDLNCNEIEEKAINEVLKSKWISMGPKVKSFEEAFSAHIGRREGVAVNSCTAALHLAMKLINAGPGDEVIVPSLTFAATANAVLYVHATPIFADITSVHDWTLSVEDIEMKITKKTKAIVVMHYAGFSCDMDSIVKLAKKHGLYVIEDAAHAPGGFWRGDKVGTKGDIACYSFYSNKNITTAEGGMLLTDNPEWSERARRLRSHGMTANAVDRKDSYHMYDITEVGYNYRLDDIRAALGLVQLNKIDADIEKRNYLAKYYIECLKDSKILDIPFQNYDGQSVYYIFPVRCHGIQREEVMKKLHLMNIQTSYHYPPVHQFSAYQKFSTPLPLTEKVGASCLSLPMHFRMDKSDIDDITNQINKLEKEVLYEDIVS